eukprot:763460_1
MSTLFLLGVFVLNMDILSVTGLIRPNTIGKIGGINKINKITIGEKKDTKSICIGLGCVGGLFPGKCSGDCTCDKDKGVCCIDKDCKGNTPSPVKDKNDKMEIEGEYAYGAQFKSIENPKEYKPVDGIRGNYWMVSSNVVIIAMVIFLVFIAWNIWLNVSNCKMNNELRRTEKPG